MKIIVKDLGCVSHAYAYATQKCSFEALIQAKQNRSVYAAHHLFLCEHFPVLTVGKRSQDKHLLLTPDLLKSKGIDYVATDRGGEMTYHGPGQLVAYPVLDLELVCKDIHRYMRGLEEVIMGVLASYVLKARRIVGTTGVWVGKPPRKIAALGVRMSRWVSMHGLALNVNLDLSPFDYFVPCGIGDKGVTSMQQVLGKAVAMQEVKTRFLAIFMKHFNLEGA